MGYQRVASIHRLPSSNPTQQKSRTIAFEVILYSTGHGKTLASLEELIKHRLDEAYLPGLGPLDPEASCIKRLEDSMPGTCCFIQMPRTLLCVLCRSIKRRNEKSTHLDKFVW